MKPLAATLRIAACLGAMVTTAAQASEAVAADMAVATPRRLWVGAFVDRPWVAADDRESTAAPAASFVVPARHGLRLRPLMRWQVGDQSSVALRPRRGGLVLTLEARW